MKRVLFVDDEPQVLQGLRAGLYARRKQWHMEFADSAARALELMKESRFDVLVTDLRMPGVDGTTLVAKARSESPDTIRIVLSGYADEEQSRRLVSLAHRYLSKPCELKRLEECIERCLGTQSLIESEELRTHLGSIGALPPIPSTFAALQRALADPGVDSSKVAAIIQKDPGISAKVLQVCNSAFFRLPRRVSSIQQAVSYLGLSPVRSMVLSAELFAPGQMPCPDLDLTFLQKHALSVAGIARWLAADTAWAEDAFLAGLLHDVGLLLLGRHHGNQMQAVPDATAAGTPLVDAEKKIIGIDHAAAGAYLLGLWGLPYDVVDAVAQHETFDRTCNSSFDVSSAVAIAHALLTEIKPQDVPPYERNASTFGDDYLRSIGLPHSWESLHEQAGQLLDTAEAA